MITARHSIKIDVDQVPLDAVLFSSRSWHVILKLCPTKRLNKLFNRSESLYTTEIKHDIRVKWQQQQRWAITKNHDMNDLSLTLLTS